MQQLGATTKHSHFHHSIVRYSFIQQSQLGRQWRERKCPLFETVAKGDSDPGSLDCESGILLLRYRSPLSLVFFFQPSSSPVFFTSLLTQSSHLSLGLPRLLPSSHNSAAPHGFSPLIPTYIVGLYFSRHMPACSSVVHFLPRQSLLFDMTFHPTNHSEPEFIFCAQHLLGQPYQVFIPNRAIHLLGHPYQMLNPNREK